MNDPVVLEPRLWFAVLCNAVGSDQAGRITLQGVFNQIQYFVPDEASGLPPHAALNGILAVGLTDGLGHFEWQVEMRDLDDKLLWSRPEGLWSFDMGPGERKSAVLAQEVRNWLRQTGQYHFRLHRPGTEVEYQIPFEVAEVIGPGRLEDPAEHPKPTR